MGIPDDEVEVAGNGDGDKEDQDLFGIWPENRGAVECFLQLRTQWRVAPMGGYLGFNYPGVESFLRMNRVKRQREVFEDLQVMESAALEIMNAQQ